MYGSGLGKKECSKSVVYACWSKFLILPCSRTHLGQLSRWKFPVARKKNSTFRFPKGPLRIFPQKWKLLKLLHTSWGHSLGQYKILFHENMSSKVKTPASRGRFLAMLRKTEARALEAAPLSLEAMFYGHFFPSKNFRGTLPYKSFWLMVSKSQLALFGVR